MCFMDLIIRRGGESVAMTNKKVPVTKKLKDRAMEIADYADEVVKKNPEKRAILLCEGNKNSIDFMLYSEAYPEFIVIPSDGCTDIIKLMFYMRKYCEYETFGIIDRDNNSKKQMKLLAENKNIFCTKLPFIENIVCCPEVLKILCMIRGIDYGEMISKVRKRMTNLLAERMSLLNPFNVDLPADEEVQLVSITIVTKHSEVHKNIDLYNIMYTFRDKSILGNVADAFNLKGKEAYIRFFRDALKGRYRDKILLAVSKYLPVLKIGEPEN